MRIIRAPWRRAGYALFVDCRSWRDLCLPKHGVAQLRGQAVLQVEKASLTDVFDLGASLADLRLLEAHPGARAPSEHSEGPLADLALLSVLLLSHADVPGGRRE